MRELKDIENIYVLSAIKLLILTACRKGEILSLKWDYIDFNNSCMNLPDSKTGAKKIHLNPSAMSILQSLEKVMMQVVQFSWLMALLQLRKWFFRFILVLSLLSLLGFLITILWTRFQRVTFFLLTPHGRGEVLIVQILPSPFRYFLIIHLWASRPPLPIRLT